MPCEDAPCCGCCGTSLYGSEVPEDGSEMTKDDYLELMMAEDYEPYDEED
jgi:hypothetical protein